MPWPTATNLPFQPVAGSQTSTLMSESLVGVSVACTRQNAGMSLYDPAPTPGGAPGEAGCWKAPAGTSVAEVTLPSSLRLARLAQSLAEAGMASVRAATAPPSAKSDLVFILLPLRARLSA